MKKPSKVVLRTGIALILIAFNMHLSAQENTPKDSLWKSMNLTEFVVTAHFMPTSVQDADYQVEVIKGADIEKMGFNNLAEVLNQQINLQVTTDPILGNGLKIQGVGGENVQIMLDGVPVIGRLNGNIDLSQINMNNVQQIEIIKGALSTQFGSNASGGVINIISKKSQEKALNFSASSQIESIQANINMLSAGLKFGKFYANLNGTFNTYTFQDEIDSLRIVEEIIQEDGSTIRRKKNPWNPKIQQGFDAMLKYAPNKSTSIYYKYSHFDETLSIYGEYKRPIYLPYSFDDTFQTLRKDHHLNFETTLNKKVHLNALLAYNQYDRVKTALRIDHEPDTSSLVDGGQDTTQYNALLNRNVLNISIRKNIEWAIGSEILIENAEGSRIIDSLSNPVNSSQLSNFALWTSVKYSWEKVSVKANLRSGYNTKFKHPLIPALHLSWKLTDKSKLMLNFASGFRAPTLKEQYFRFVDTNHYIIGNKDLIPEYSESINLNFRRFKSTTAKRTLDFNSSIFYNNIRDRIVLAEFEPGRYNYQNLAQYKVHGMSTEIRYGHSKHLDFKFGLSLNRIYNALESTFEGADRFSNLWETQNQLNLSLPKQNLSLTINHRLIGQQIVYFINDIDELSQGFTGQYQLMDCNMNKRFFDGKIDLGIGVKNIMDVRSIPIGGQRSGNHSSGGGTQLVNWGRNIFVRAKLNLG